jgi:hypothetical protein
VSTGSVSGIEYPSQIWYFVDLRKPILVSCMVDEDTEHPAMVDLREHLSGWVGDGPDETGGLYAVVTPMADVPKPLAVGWEKRWDLNLMRSDNSGRTKPPSSL